MKRIKILLFICFCFLLPPLLIASPYNENNFLVISDLHLDRASSHLMEINPAKVNNENDLDYPTLVKLIENLITNIKNDVISKPNFIVILGDIVGHLRSNSESAIESESAVYSILKNNFPGIPIFYIFGNNDSLKINYGPFQDHDRPNKLNSPYEIAKENGGWINGFLSTGEICKNGTGNFPCLITENTQHGFYSAYIEHGFRFIALNSVLFSPRRTQVTEQDAIDQLQWLKEQLTASKENHESALIAMHIPPGNNIYDHSNFWFPKEQSLFLKIIKDYQDIIVGTIASHTHEEELKVIKDDSNKNVSGLYLIAGLSTSHGNSPSVKTFYFSENNAGWQLSNYETFHFTTDYSNIILNKLYDYNHYYCGSLKKDQLLECMNNITVDKLKTYYTAGNPNYNGTINSPEDIVLIANTFLQI